MLEKTVYVLYLPISIKYIKLMKVVYTRFTVWLSGHNTIGKSINAVNILVKDIVIVRQSTIVHCYVEKLE